jgi:hypothetical protein
MKALESSLNSCLEATSKISSYDRDGKINHPSFKELMGIPSDQQIPLILLICERLKDGKVSSLLKRKKPITHANKETLKLVFSNLLRRKQNFNEDHLLVIASSFANINNGWSDFPQTYYGATISRFIKAGNTPSQELIECCKSLINDWGGGNSDSKKWAKKLRDALGDQLGIAPTNPLKSNGEIFAQAILDDLAETPEDLSNSWVKLLAHAAESSAGTPTKKWITTSTELINEIGVNTVIDCLNKWFPLINKPALDNESRNIVYGTHVYRPDPMSFCDEHLSVLKGLAWLAGLIEDNTLTRTIGIAGVSSYKKIPEVGPRATRVGNACVWSLGNLGTDTALAQLALMKTKVKFGTAQKSIQKALSKLAEKIGVSTDELEEMSVPEYGLTEMGKLIEPLGQYTAVITVEGRKPTLSFINPKGSVIKSVPAAVKADHSEELKELRGISKDLEKMLSAQKERLDNLFLLEKKWDLKTWLARYHDHPVVGTLSRRLIWVFEDEGSTDAVIWLDGAFVNSQGSEVQPGKGTSVSIWHPINSSAESVLAWRRFLFEHMVQQPFKQAHREVYILTEAEVNTGIYSNRFASHILKQHQFNSLCALRGWKNTLRLMVDDSYPPASKILSKWGLRAEFWIEGVGDDWNEEYVLDSGAFRYIATDQVRFYPIESQQVHAHAGGGGYGPGWNSSPPEDPIPLSEIPPLVLSEVLRDVDLFVGVASVGNDPNWSDGGPDGHFQDYWQQHSFGNLGETAEMRKDIIQSLLPRLKIADIAHIDGRFLNVN